MTSQRQSTKEKNLQVTRLESEKLRIDHDALREVFIRPDLEGKKFAIISIAGKTRTGKSFLMNFVLRYLRRRGWENNDWMGDDNYAIDVDGLPFAGGTERCTTGIRIFDEIFEVPAKGDETMIVMLMDTQGLFDNKTPEIVNKSLLTLTTMMSSVQIFNSKDNVDAQSMAYLKTCVDFALKTTKATANKGAKSEGYMKLQSLMFLVRDFPENDDEIFGLEIGNKYLEEILTSPLGGEELIKIRSRIKESFDSVEGFAMPHPGMKAMKNKFQARNKDIEDYFRVYVQQFVEHIINPRNLVPKRSSTKAITPREMLNMIAACDNIFAKKIFDAENIMKMNEKTYYSSMCQEAILAYDEIMKECIHEKTDIEQLQKKHSDSKETAVPELRDAEFVGGDDTYDWKEHYLQHFSTQCENHFADTLQKYKVQQQNRELETKSALLEYQSKMKDRMSPPLSDIDFEALHEKQQQAVLNSCSESGDLDNIMHSIIEVYENLKEENKCRREKAEKRKIERQKEKEQLQKEMEQLKEDQHDAGELKQKLEQQMREQEKEDAKRKLIQRLTSESKTEWKKFLETQPDEAAMSKKKAEMFSRLFSKFSEVAGQDQGTAHTELLEELTCHYEDAKRQSEQQWDLVKQTIDNIVDKLVLDTRLTLSQKMVDRHISEDAIKKSFSQLMDKDMEDVVDRELKTMRAKQYFKQILKQKSDDAIKDVLGLNSKYQKSNEIKVNDVVNIVEKGVKMASLLLHVITPLIKNKK